MCKICGFLFCPSGCPCYSGEWEGSGAVLGRCAVCEGALHQGESAFARGTVLICAGCAAALELDQLLYLAELEDRAALLCEGLGFAKRRL